MAQKLLIINDQPGVAKVISLIAIGLGFDTRVQTCPFQAVELFIDFRPNVVILDMIMPEKDGINVLNEILLTGIACRIVLTSGLTDAYLRLAEGIARFHTSDVAILRKPFRRQELVSALCRNEPHKIRRGRMSLVVSA